MEALLAGGAAGAVLAAMWWGASRRHSVRRQVAAGDWGEAGTRPELWTSGARCPDCRASGGLLDAQGDELWFTCLECGRRHRREHRG